MRHRSSLLPVALRSFVGMSEDAIARARAIAAKLGAVVASGGGTALGKRSLDAEPIGLGALKRKKVYIPVDQHPDVNFLGLLIGPRGETQKLMQQLSGAKILIRGRGAHKEGAGNVPHPDDDDDLHVCIEGTEEAIERALRDVEKILFDPEQAMRLKSEQLRSLGSSQYGPAVDEGNQVEMRVPNGVVGLIIGKGGETIQRIQAQTGGHLQIAKESEMKPGETTRLLTLKGTPSAIEDLKKKIEEIISGSSAAAKLQAAMGYSELPHAFVIKIPVPNDKVGCIIGRGGSTVKGIQEKTKAHVQIPTGPDEDNPAVRTISVGADTREAAEACQLEIFMVLQQQAGSSVANPQNSINILVPDDKVGIIIGRGGSTIKDIQQRCQVRVQIPQSADPGSNPPVRTCSIIGSPEAQYIARYEIESILGLAPGGSYYSGAATGGYQSSSAAGGGWAGGSVWGGYGAAAADPYYSAAYSQAYAAQSSGVTASAGTGTPRLALTG